MEIIVVFENTTILSICLVAKWCKDKGFYVRVRGKAWGLGELGWYVGMCCGEGRKESLIHHTAGELFNAWQAPWSLVNRINKISISQKMKAPCHKLCQQQQPCIWASLSLSRSCFASVLLRDQIPGYLTHSENNFNFSGRQNNLSVNRWSFHLKLSWNPINIPQHTQ